MNYINKFIRMSKPNSPTEREKLLEELKKVELQLKNNDLLFNMTCDFDMIDFYIHEQQALFKRYGFLLKQVREEDEMKTMLAKQIALSEQQAPANTSV